MKQYIVTGIITAIVASTLIGNAYSALTMTPCDKLSQQGITDMLNNRRDLNSNDSLTRLAAQARVKNQYNEYTKKATELGCG